MKYSVNIEVIYKEMPFAERFAAAKRDGFNYVEIWDWDSKDLDELVALCRKYDIEISCMGGDGPISLCDPAHGAEYLTYLRKSLQVAQKVGCKLLAVHSNALQPEPLPYPVDTFPQYTEEEKTALEEKNKNADALLSMCSKAMCVTKSKILEIFPLSSNYCNLIRFANYTKRSGIRKHCISWLCWITCPGRTMYRSARIITISATASCKH